MESEMYNNFWLCNDHLFAAKSDHGGKGREKIQEGYMTTVEGCLIRSGGTERGEKSQKEKKVVEMLEWRNVFFSVLAGPRHSRKYY